MRSQGRRVKVILKLQMEMAENDHLMAPLTLEILIWDVSMKWALWFFHVQSYPMIRFQSIRASIENRIFRESGFPKMRLISCTEVSLTREYWSRHLSSLKWVCEFNRRQTWYVEVSRVRQRYRNFSKLNFDVLQRYELILFAIRCSKVETLARVSK